MFGHPSYRNRTELDALPSGGTWPSLRGQALSARQIIRRAALIARR
jgi:hypothetical protein